MAQGWGLQEHGRQMDLPFVFRLQSQYLRDEDDEARVGSHSPRRKISGLYELVPGLKFFHQDHKKEDFDLQDPTA